MKKTPFILKWLRYYLDFCLKYKFNQSDKESLPEFLNKLREKNQTSQQQKQASDAISIYYETETQQPESIFQTVIKILSFQKDKMNQNRNVLTGNLSMIH
jgi:hypothetical protein